MFFSYLMKNIIYLRIIVESNFKALYTSNNSVDKFIVLVLQ